MIRRCSLVLVIGLTSLLAGPAAGRDISPSPAGPARLELLAPSQVAVGETIPLTLRIVDADGIAGYEAAVLFDPSVAEYAGVQQRQNDLKGFGRDVGPLTAVELSAGAAVGLFSCPVSNCVTGQGGANTLGGQGSIQLATVFVVGNQPGWLEIKLDAIKFVDGTGNPVVVETPQPSVTIQVGAPAHGLTHVAPDPMWSLTPSITAGSAAALGPFDLTGDGQVSHADAMEVALAWQLARQQQVACGPLEDVTRDVNHDGCLDVADVQLVAAHFGQATPGGPEPSLYLPLVDVSGAGTTPTQTPSTTQPPAPTPTPTQVATTTYTVNSTSDQGDGNIGNGECRTGAGVCTLRAAIQEANAGPGPETINFNIPGAGVRTIVLNGKLPSLSGGGITIDGYTQPGSAVNTHPLASNAQIMVQIQGDGSNSFDGLVITSAGNTIRGLALYQLQRPFWIYGSGATHNTIVGCFVGTNAAGTYGAPGLAPFAHGFHIEQGASYNQIGSPALADRNVISGNARHGLGIWHENSIGNVVMNNIVGLNPSGTNRVPNRKHGLDINYGSSHNLFGGTGVYEHNVISGNDDTGTELSHTPETTENQVIGNYYGTDLTGNASPGWAPNLGRGIMIEDGATGNTIAHNVVGTSGQGAIEVYDSHTFGNVIRDNRIGISLNGAPIPSAFGIWAKGAGLVIGPGNLIAYMTNVGIKIQGDDADSNTITRNAIFQNGGLGIDVFPRGVNEPDEYPKTGPNQGINFPILQSASPESVTGTACPGCTVEIFIADTSSAAYGEGQTFVGSGTAAGNGNFAIAVSGPVSGDYVTATATDGAGNTSEFSLNRQVTP